MWANSSPKRQMRQGPANPGPNLRLEWLCLISGSSQLRSVCGGCSAIVIAWFAVAGIKASDNVAVGCAPVSARLDGFQTGNAKATFLDTLLILCIVAKTLQRRHGCRQHRGLAQPLPAATRVYPPCLQKPTPRKRGQWGRSGCSPERKRQSPSARVALGQDQSLRAGCPEAPAGCKVWPMA